MSERSTTEQLVAMARDEVIGEVMVRFAESSATSVMGMRMRMMELGATVDEARYGAMGGALGAFISSMVKSEVPPEEVILVLRTVAGEFERSLGQDVTLLAVTRKDKVLS